MVVLTGDATHNYEVFSDDVHESYVGFKEGEYKIVPKNDLKQCIGAAGKGGERAMKLVKTSTAPEQLWIFKHF